jgi:hypothetical protein
MMRGELRYANVIEPRHEDHGSATFGKNLARHHDGQRDRATRSEGEQSGRPEDFVFLGSAECEKPHNRHQGIDTIGPYGGDQEAENRFA